MKWVEGMVDPRVWTVKGPLGLNEIVQLSDEDADFLIERGQVIEVPPPAGTPKKRGRPKGSKNKPKAVQEGAEAKED